MYLDELHFLRTQLNETEISVDCKADHKISLRMQFVKKLKHWDLSGQKFLYSAKKAQMFAQGLI